MGRRSRWDWNLAIIACIVRKRNAIGHGEIIILTDAAAEEERFRDPVKRCFMSTRTTIMAERKQCLACKRSNPG